MNCFLVERNLPGLTAASLATLQRALRAASQRLSTPDAPVRYVGSIYQLRRQTCLCLFEATGADIVRLTNETAQAPFTHIHDTVVLFEKGIDV